MMSLRNLIHELMSEIDQKIWEAGLKNRDEISLSIKEAEQLSAELFQLLEDLPLDALFGQRMRG